MTTVSKNFRVKHGLVVEGSTATVGGQNVLTETGGDSYILNLVGGATLVKSVSSDFKVTVGGELQIDSLSDLARTGDIPTKQDLVIGSPYLTTAEDMVAGTVLTLRMDQVESTLVADGFAKTTDISTAIDALSTDQIEEGATNLYFTEGRARSAINAGTGIDYNSATGYIDANLGTGLGLDGSSQIEINRTTVDAWYDAAGAAATAEQNAKDYADDLIDDASTSSTEVWSAYKTSTEIGLAQTAAEGFATQAIANLVDSAPATLDTLNELAAALQDNPDIISDLQDIAAGKQDTLTAGTGIDIASNTISVDVLDLVGGSSAGYVPTTEKSGKIAIGEIDLHTALDSRYDAAGAAATAQENAEDYADGLASNYDAAGTASGLVNDLKNGTTAFTEINVNSFITETAYQAVGLTSANLGVLGSVDSATYRSAKAIIKFSDGTNTQISEIVATLDSANNIAQTEYAIVTTNGVLADTSFSYKGSSGAFQIIINVVEGHTVTATAAVSWIK